MSAESDDAVLAASFDNEVAMYQKFRPGYPEAMLDAMVQHAGLLPTARVLEIGCGTGQATIPMALRGYDLTAVEPGAELAKAAGAQLDGQPNAKVVNASFEAVELPEKEFDLVFAAMSLHWVNEAERFHKPHRLLKPDGHLAVLYNWPLADEESAPFYQSLAEIAGRYGYPADAFQPIRQEEIGIRPAFDESLFDEPTFMILHMMHKFKPGLVYAGFLATLSAVIVQPRQDRLAFLGDVSKMIDEEFNGMADLPYLSTLAIAGKKGEA